jgi:predicted lipoprotein with Yx(FWY)xxD motif
MVCGRKGIEMEAVMRKGGVRFAMCAVLTLALAGVAIADQQTIKISEKAGVGKFFTDSKGMTLYIFKKDSPGKSACAGPCVEKWPPYFREKVSVPDGVLGGDFGTINREDEKRQTTYKGSPLYYFAGDKAPGDLLGHGLGDVWFVAMP